MIKLDPNQLQFLQSRHTNRPSKEVSEDQPKGVRSNAPVSTVSLSGQQMSSFSLFQKTVMKRLEVSFNGSNIQPQQSSAPDKVEQALLAAKEKRAEVASSNILKFIGRQLKADAENGASPEKLESRLAAALKGYESGFGEANSILSDMGLMSDDVESDVALTDSKVRDGLSSLVKEYLGEDESSDLLERIDAGRVSNADDSSDEPAESEDTGGSSSAINSQYSQLSASEGRSFSFKLETKEGDVVEINARALQWFSAEQYSSQQRTSGSGLGPGGIQQTSGVGFEAGNQSEFALRIDGDLDDDELKAINDLLKQVNSLSEDFYGGDIQKALEKALSLGYDSTEIGSFSLNLSQMSSVKAVQAYQSDEAFLKPNVLTELKPLGKFAAQVSQSLMQAKENFANPETLVSDLVQNISNLNQQDGRETIVELYSFSETIIQQFNQRLIASTQDSE